MKRLLVILLLVVFAGIGYSQKNAMFHSGHYVTDLWLDSKKNVLVAEYAETSSVGLALRPDKYYRIIYGVVNGRIAPIDTVYAKTIPAQSERIEWPEERR